MSSISANKLPYVLPFNPEPLPPIFPNPDMESLSEDLKRSHIDSPSERQIPNSPDYSSDTNTSSNPSENLPGPLLAPFYAHSFQPDEIRALPSFATVVQPLNLPVSTQTNNFEVSLARALSSFILTKGQQLAQQQLLALRQQLELRRQQLDIIEENIRHDSQNFPIWVTLHEMIAIEMRTKATIGMETEPA